MKRRHRVLITGGTRGIGRALVELYRNQGWQVVTCGRDPGLVARLDALDGVSAEVVDLAVLHDRDRLVRLAGPLDGIIHNAAIQSRHVVGEAGYVATHEEIAINLLAPLALTEALMPELRQGAFVANVTSGLAYVPLARCPVYCATKAGLSMYTRAARLQGPHVSFIEVLLPMVDTDMTRGRGRDKMSPEEVARQIRSGIERREATVRVGKARLLPALLRLAPSLLTRMLNGADRPLRELPLRGPSAPQARDAPGDVPIG